MREGQRDAVFEEEKRSFNAPTAVIEILEILKLDTALWKIGHKELHIAIVESELDKAKGEMKDRGLVRGRDKVKSPAGADVFLLIVRHVGKIFAGTAEKEVGRGFIKLFV